MIACMIVVCGLVYVVGFDCLFVGFGLSLGLVTGGFGCFGVGLPSLSSVCLRLIAILFMCGFSLVVSVCLALLAGGLLALGCVISCFVVWG